MASDLTNNLLQSTGNDVRTMRIKLGLSQRELGMIAGCSGQNIMQVEQDYARQSTPRTVKLAIILEACKSKEVLVLFKRKEMMEKIRELEKKNAALKTFILTELTGKLSLSESELDNLHIPDLENMMLALIRGHIKQYRKRLGLTVTTVGKMMGYTRQTVSKLEKKGSPDALINEFRVLKNYDERNKNKEEKNGN